MLKKTKIKRRNTMEPRQAGFEPERSSTWEQSWSIYLNPKEDLTQCTEISLTEKHIYIYWLFFLLRPRWSLELFHSTELLLPSASYFLFHSVTTRSLCCSHGWNVKMRKRLTFFCLKCVNRQCNVHFAQFVFCTVLVALKYMTAVLNASFITVSTVFLFDFWDKACLISFGKLCSKSNHGKRHLSHLLFSNFRFSFLLQIFRCGMICGTQFSSVRLERIKKWIFQQHIQVVQDGTLLLRWP